MRKTTKSPGEKIVKEIKRATRKHYSSEVDLSRFDAAPLIAFTATKEKNYETEPH